MTSLDERFLSRANQIPFHGTGLSVDLHVPDLFELAEALSLARLPYDYLEIFKAPLSHLIPARRKFPDRLPVEYHADGLWFTQPEFPESAWEEECHRIARHTRALGSSWITHECATKEMAGRSVGTYLPPLLTPEAARLAGAQGEMVQNRLDELAGGHSPLLLIEVPPFYTFAAGNIPLEAFFRELSRQTSCGLLLDVGHIYSYYLSSELEKTTSTADFLSRFLEHFPLHRVVQIHLGGLRPFHGTFLDDHASPVPPILFDLLEEILRHPGLVNLKGAALEVDTKEIPLIITEYARFLDICRATGPNQGETRRKASKIQNKLTKRRDLDLGRSRDLEQLYLEYFNALAGGFPEQENPVFPMFQVSQAAGSLLPFQRDYLNDQVLNWSGKIEEIFPGTVQILSENGVSLERFVPWFFNARRDSSEPFDFFKIKLGRFRDFALEISRTLSQEQSDVLAGEAKREYLEILESYLQFNPAD